MYNYSHVRKDYVSYIWDPLQVWNHNFDVSNVLLWQAIRNDEFGVLEAAVKALKTDRLDQLLSDLEAEKGVPVPGEHSLDVCDMILYPNTTDQYCPMTLLAYAGYHARVDMLAFLVSEGARKSHYWWQIKLPVCACIVIISGMSNSHA